MALNRLWSLIRRGSDVFHRYSRSLHVRTFPNLITHAYPRVRFRPFFYGPRKWSLDVIASLHGFLCEHAWPMRASVTNELREAPMKALDAFKQWHMKATGKHLFSDPKAWTLFKNTISGKPAFLYDELISLFISFIVSLSRNRTLGSTGSSTTHSKLRQHISHIEFRFDYLVSTWSQTRSCNVFSSGFPVMLPVLQPPLTILNYAFPRPRHKLVQGWWLQMILDDEDWAIGNLHEAKSCFGCWGHSVSQ